MRRSMGQTMNEEEPNYLVTYKTIINNIFDLKLATTKLKTWIE